MMKRNLYMSDSFCAVEENGRLVEFHPVIKEDQTGQILKGKVERIVPGLEAVFVDIGRKKAGFLPLKETSQTFQGSGIQSGDWVMVQIKKEENGDKGAFLTRDLTIAGSYLILMPMNRHIGVSARVRDEAMRQHLLGTGQKLADGKMGLVLREAAVQATEEMLSKEMKSLSEEWEQIRAGETINIGPKEDLIRDYTPRRIDTVQELNELPSNLIRQLKESKNRRIRLPHGGNIVIDPCEAMTVIDVNSASDTGDGNRRETILRANLEACQEIMIQVRLRDLSGILILDMIDMDNESDRSLILNALQEAFQHDRIKTVIHGYTRLGLIEMTRKRSRAAWQEKQRM